MNRITKRKPGKGIVATERYWEIDLINQMKKVFSKKVKLSSMSDKNVKQFIETLMAKYA
ncbi:MAG: hypothetical protein NTW29_01725 [Bacteroidetes bacterium]|nr:hypothetical protein [Bacteroidota bacterium]